MTSYLLSRIDLEKQEEMLLAPYAVHSSRSQGRRFPESEHPLRTAFQRDRDRVIHSGAFRRLKYKTQVFADYENDHFRTRLTHTMEVAQISRTIARSLRLNEDLSEGIALVHDLGHTPFGHAGEAAMQEILRDHGGFNHNAQSLRVVEYLEDRYPGFRGLNLTFELREGIIRHETDYDLPALVGFDPSLRAPLEGQIVNLADEIAYNAHDVDDGVFSAFISWDELRAVPYLDRLFHISHTAFPDLTEHKRHYHLIRLLIDHAVSDLIKHTAGQLEEMGIKTLDEVIHAEKNIVSFSPQGRADYTELKRFLLDKLYRHPALLETNSEARRIVDDLFNAYLKQPELLPEKYRRQVEGLNPHEVVRDYVAGMTDRFAHQEHRRIFG